MTLSDHQWEFLKDVAKLIFYIEEKGYKATGGHLYRTPEQQKIYVQTGKSRTMKSKHLKKLAVDLNIFIEGRLTYDKNELQDIGDFWESLYEKNEWGGNWSFIDTPHFERNV